MINSEYIKVTDASSFSRDMIHTIAERSEDRLMQRQHKDVCDVIEEAANQGKFSVVIDAVKVSWEFYRWLERKSFSVHIRDYSEDRFRRFDYAGELTRASEVRISWT